MELREYLTIRRAYNLVRQGVDARRRLTFVEFAILSHLTLSQNAARTSDIAEYQGSLRPTMTHRTKHLTELGFLSREKGGQDRRNVVCTVTDEGVAYTNELCGLVCNVLKEGTVLSRTTPRRINYYIDAMGAFNCMSGDLVLLSIYYAGDDLSTVSSLVESLGLLQPTVSMSISSLEDEGLVTRYHVEGVSRVTGVTLTESGYERAESVKDRIREIVVRRSR